jgi:hypothetical protein
MTLARITPEETNMDDVVASLCNIGWVGQDTAYEFKRTSYDKKGLQLRCKVLAYIMWNMARKYETMREAYLELDKHATQEHRADALDILYKGAID